MRLQSLRQLENTRRKLHQLEEMRESLVADVQEDAYIREESLDSINGLIKQLKEEIAWFESRQVVRS